MNLITCKTLKSGKMRVTVDIDPGQKLVAIYEDAYYELGEPLDDVVQGHIIADADRVTWCPIGQGWVKP
jgi:hypothetical protein